MPATLPTIPWPQRSTGTPSAPRVSWCCRASSSRPATPSRSCTRGVSSARLPATLADAERRRSGVTGALREEPDDAFAVRVHQAVEPTAVDMRHDDLADLVAHRAVDADLFHELRETVVVGGRRDVVDRLGAVSVDEEQVEHHHQPLAAQ